MASYPDFFIDTISQISQLPNVTEIGIFSWPDTDGVSGGVLTTNGEGNLSFTENIGEVNTASNVNTVGTGVYKQKTNFNLEFKGIQTGSTKLTVTDAPATNTINLDVDPTNISHTSLQDKGTNTHSQIDTHIASISNPHIVTLEQARTTGSTLSGTIDMGSNTINNIPDPTTSLQVANKQYVDSIASGLVLEHAPCRATTTANIAGTYVGTPTFTLTEVGNGALPAQDGVTMVATNRLLLKDQTDGKQNGIYVITQVGDGASPYILTRASDYDDNLEINSGDFIFIQEGTSYQNSGFVLSTLSPNLDVTDFDFTQFSGTQTITAGSGLQQVGNVFSVLVDGSTIEISGSLRVKNAGITNAKLDKANIPYSGFGAASAEVDIGSQNLKALTLESDVATGTAPITVASTTKVPNLYSATTGGLSTATNTVSVDGSAAPLGEGYILQTTSATTAGWAFPTSSYGNFWMYLNTVPTILPAPSTWVKVQGSTTPGGLKGFTHTNNRLTCIDVNTYSYMIVVTATCQSALQSETFSIGVAINGVIQNSGRMATRAFQANQPYSNTVNTIVDLSLGDYVELFIADMNAANTWTVTGINFSLFGVG